jgi:hypothetical protein
MPFSLRSWHIRDTVWKFSGAILLRRLIIVVSGTFFALTLVVTGATPSPFCGKFANQGTAPGPAFGKATGDSATSANESRPSASQSLANFDRPQRCSRRQLRMLVHNARTAADHAKLAVYFRTRERECRINEAAQQGALREYLREYAKYPSKYPTRGDIARGLAAYYGQQAKKAADQALEHETLATALRAKE